MAGPENVPTVIARKNTILRYQKEMVVATAVYPPDSSREEFLSLFQRIFMFDSRTPPKSQ